MVDLKGKQDLQNKRCTTPVDGIDPLDEEGMYHCCGFGHIPLWPKSSFMTTLGFNPRYAGPRYMYLLHK
jgi:hypothetical protein